MLPILTCPHKCHELCSWNSTSRRVLTMEWIDGVKLTDKPAMGAAGLSITEFVDIGIECTLRQLLEHGWFHADPHPGALSRLQPTMCASAVFFCSGILQTDR